MSQVTPHNATAGHPGSHVANVCRSLARAEALCHAVAGRDLGDAPLYIVPQSTLPQECGSGDRCYGYTTPSLDLYLAPHIAGYQGRGPCMVINDRALAEEFDDDLKIQTIVYVLHELAHILDRPELFAERAGVDPDKLRIEALVVADVTAHPPRAHLPAYFGHEIGFIRVALHLCHRVRRLGFDIRAAAICAGPLYGLSPAAEYRDALRDEPSRYADMLFRNIAATKPPPAFSSLWCDDYIAYHQRFLYPGVFP